jgi:hypothetical protein
MSPATKLKSAHWELMYPMKCSDTLESLKNASGMRDHWIFEAGPILLYLSILIILLVVKNGSRLLYEPELLKPYYH